MQVQVQPIQFSFTQYLIKHEHTITFLIKKLTRSNVMLDFLIKGFEIRNY